MREPLAIGHRRGAEIMFAIGERIAQPPVTLSPHCYTLFDPIAKTYIVEVKHPGRWTGVIIKPNPNFLNAPPVHKSYSVQHPDRWGGSIDTDRYSRHLNARNGLPENFDLDRPQ